MTSGSSLDTRVGKRAVHYGYFTLPQIQEVISFYKIFKRLDLPIPFHQVFLERWGSEDQCLQHLLILYLREAEPITLIKELDPLAVSIGAEWFLLIKSLETSSIPPPKLYLCNLILEDMYQQGIFASLVEILVLKGFIPENLIQESCERSIPTISRTEEEKKEIRALESICKRKEGENWLPPSLPVSELSTLVIPNKIVEDCAKYQLHLKDRWRLDMPLIYILTRKYLVDLFLLHALVLAQSNIDNSELVIRLGNFTFKKVKISSKLQNKLVLGQQKIEEFLTWSYRSKWLDFPAEEEERLVSYWEKCLIAKHFNKAVKIQKKLQSHGFNLSITKILVYQGLLKDQDLLEAVGAGIQNQSVKYEVKRPRAHMTMILDRKTLGLPPLPEPSQAEKSPQVVTSSPTEEPASPVKVSLVEEPPPPVSLDEAMNSYHALSPAQKGYIFEIAIKEKCIDEKILQDNILSQENQIQPEQLLKILIEKNGVDRDRLAKILSSSPILSDTASIPEVPTKLDRVLCRMLYNQNIVSKDNLKHALNLQKQMKEIGIIRDISNLLIQCRMISPSMAHRMKARAEAESKSIEEEPAFPWEITDKPSSMQQEKSISAYPIPAPKKIEGIHIPEPAFKVERKQTASATKKVEGISKVAYKGNADQTQPKKIDVDLEFKELIQRTQRIELNKLRSKGKKESYLSKYQKAALILLPIFLIILARLLAPSSKNSIPPKPEPIKFESNNKENQKQSPTPGSTPRPSHDEILNKAMSHKGYVRWNQWWVKEEEAQILINSWGAQGERARENLLSAKDFRVTVESLSQIILEGELESPPVPKGRFLIGIIELFHPLERKKTYATKQILIPINEVFHEGLGPFPKPLLQGFYVLNLTLSPSIQDPLLCYLFKINSPLKYEIIFGIGSKDSILTELKNDETRFKKWIEKFTLLQETFISHLNEPPSIIHQKWEGWAPKWKEDKDQLTKEFSVWMESTLTPRFPETEVQFDLLLRYLDSAYQKFKEWHFCELLTPPKERILLDNLQEILIQMKRTFKSEVESLIDQGNKR